jgi:hypothetical protein
LSVVFFESGRPFESIAEQMFSGCFSLSQVTIPWGATIYTTSSPSNCEGNQMHEVPRFSSDDGIERELFVVAGKRSSEKARMVTR